MTFKYHLNIPVNGDIYYQICKISLRKRMQMNFRLL